MKLNVISTTKLIWLKLFYFSLLLKTYLYKTFNKKQTLKQRLKQVKYP